MTDGLLTTGQNPASSGPAARALLTQLQSLESPIVSNAALNGPQPLLDPTFIASQRQRLEVIRAKVSDAVDHGVDEDLDLALNARNNASETEDRAQESTISDNNRILNGDLVRYRSSIDRALAKIDEGTYGLSDESGLPIPAERLNAYPQATRTASEEARHLNTLQIR